MSKMSFGLFGLMMILGNQLGAQLGMAIVLCMWMITDGLIEEVQRRLKNKPKKEVK